MVIQVHNESGHLHSTSSAYFDFGFRYYVAGRLAAAERFHPVAANLLHHAIAMFLLSGICTHTTEEERTKLGNDLNGIWNVFKDRISASNDLSRFDKTVRALQEFEVIGRPETMGRETKSELLPDEIEMLMKAICGATGINRTHKPATVVNLNAADRVGSVVPRSSRPLSCSGPACVKR